MCKQKKTKTEQYDELFKFVFESRTRIRIQYRIVIK